jgi:hypothetical protein
VLPCAHHIWARRCLNVAQKSSIFADVGIMLGGARLAGLTVQRERNASCMSSMNTAPGSCRVVLGAIEGAVAFADPCKRPLLSNLDCLVLSVKVRKVTLDVHFTINFIVS